MRKTAELSPDLPPVCRFGLATRGNTHLRQEDVEYAIERGLNHLNWCGHPDGMSGAIAALGPRRKEIVVAAQFKARQAAEAASEFNWILDQLQSSYLDIATFYYVESDEEWQEIISPGGAWEVLSRQKEAGALKMIGLTSHQRKLAAGWAQSVAKNFSKAGGSDSDPPRHAPASENSSPGAAGGRSGGSPYHLDMLMIRYNAAHRGAEQDVFPAARKRAIPVVTFTGLRWRALLRSTPDDPPGFRLPTAPECYRFCLANPEVAVALAAPGERPQLEENLTLLDDWRPPSKTRYEELRRHGDRVRAHGGEFW